MSGYEWSDGVLEWAKQKMPKREELERNRFLRPFAHRLADPGIWRFNRRSVARGTAIGLFVGIMVPVAQTPIAALFAVPTRANVAIAALMTFITNPFTTPAILFGAYETGSWMLTMHEKSVAIVTKVPDAWLTRAVAWLIDVSLPTALGLLVFSIASAILGYAGIHFGWRLWVVRRWSLRRMARAR